MYNIWAVVLDERGLEGWDGAEVAEEAEVEEQ